MTKSHDMTNEELIREHQSAWNHWKYCRRAFGELATPDNGKRLNTLELQARQRGITDDELMAPIKSHKFQGGDEVIFNVPFSNADGYVEQGEEGIVKSQPLGFRDSGLGLYGVIAQGQLWLAKENEIRLAE